MNFPQLLSLGIIQALSEFLPISSSGHLHLFQALFHLTPSLSFDVLANTATLLAVIFFFRRFFLTWLKTINLSRLYLLFLGTFPAVLAGLFFKDQLDSLFTNPAFLSLTYLLTASALFSLHFIKPKNKKLSPSRALFIGLFQALALLPGVSRSGLTITAAILAGLSPKSAFRFSFLLYLPVSLGALFLTLADGTLSTFTFAQPIFQLVLVFMTTATLGYFSLKILRRLLLGNRLWLFAFYCLFLSFSVFLFL